MRIALIVEGPSDKILLESQKAWFTHLGLEVRVAVAGDKRQMCRGAKKFHKIETIRGTRKVVFLPDQHGDPCVAFTKERVGMGKCPCAVTVVLKRELEAWMLADGRAVTAAAGKQYQPAGLTDSISDPKQELTAKFLRAVGYSPTEVEMAELVSRHFSLARAARHNTSAKRFVNVLCELAGRGSSSATGK